ncbi:phage holin family protein [Cellulomonas sp. PhB143]|uniref:phage holin family protein n=1 Tax=Cellulomonas sp. PhB143 TaxID=2485186 RepID=UPI000F492DFE|nr:phage holin family protein [Cellulomonas sp. PhB143]ROS74321.1 putative superfamily III holin-X [Cellulomonas sp. PhB143]
MSSNEPGGRAQPTVGELVSDLGENLSRLVRDEIRLATTELKESAKHAGTGAGMFGAAGILALYGFGVLIATGVIALALVVDWWLAALIVALVLFAVAAVVALLGRKQLQQASPTPERTIENVKRDVAEVKEARSA